MGVSEQVGVKVTVFRRGNQSPLHFGLPVGGYVGGSVPNGGTSSDISSLAWGRTLSGGQAGRMVFVLPSRTGGDVGEEWSELISINDWVELDVHVARTPFTAQDTARDRDSVGSTGGYQGRFAGFVHQVSRSQELSASTTSVVVHDGMGMLEQEHFGYWRNVGAVFQGQAAGDSQADVIRRLAAAGYGGNTSLIESGSIAVVTEVIFRSLLYNRLSVKWPIGKESLRWEDLHGYRFESDDYSVNVSSSVLAPDGSSWMEAVSWAIDAPQFYEFFMDNLAVGNAGLQLRNGGQNNLGVTSQVRTRVSKRVLKGGRAETFVMRPVPFPTYDPEQGGYRSAAWDGLRVIEALPFGTVGSQLARSRQDVYSIFSVDQVNTNVVNSDSAGSADANAQVVGDEQADQNKVGYRPMDVKTKRTPVPITYKAGSQVSGKQIGAPELSRRLAWQVMSFNHWNDRFLGGQIVGPLDLRAELGVRYLHEGYLFYVEGYEHSLDQDGGSTTTYSVTRGLRATEYGYIGGTYPQHIQGPSARAASLRDHANWFPNYLGRKRPGDEYGVVSGNAAQGVGTTPDGKPQGAPPGTHGP